MPLKHYTESAYLFVLALVICISGIVIALLPPLPLGLKYWGAGFAITVLYPLVLRHTFRANRADYEFRLMHWFPAGMFALWILLQLTDSYMKILHILNLGFFYLWSLPLVMLGLFFIGIFAVHVLRRQKQRILTMSIIAALFLATSVSAETLNINSELSRAVFPRADEQKPMTFAKVYDTAWERVGFIVARQKRFWRIGSTSGTLGRPGTVVSSSRSSKPIGMIASSSMKPPPPTPKPGSLTNSGPEGFALIGLALFALYTGTLHRRARERML